MTTRTVVDGLTRTRIAQYAGASGDFNPLHTDEAYAVAAGFPSVFAHGMLTMALTGTVLAEFGGELLRYGCRFVAPVWPGDTLDATVTVDAVRGDEVDLTVRTVNQRAEPILTGYATVRKEPQWT